MARVRGDRRNRPDAGAALGAREDDKLVKLVEVMEEDEEWSRGSGPLAEKDRLKEGWRTRGVVPSWRVVAAAVVVVAGVVAVAVVVVVAAVAVVAVVAGDGAGEARAPSRDTPPPPPDAAPPPPASPAPTSLRRGALSSELKSLKEPLNDACFRQSEPFKDACCPELLAPPMPASGRLEWGF